jgi:hypothetical protein
MWKRAHLCLFGARLRPSQIPRPLPLLSSFFPPSRSRTRSSASVHPARAPYAMRQATRTSHARTNLAIGSDVHAHAAQNGEEGRGAGRGREEKRESGTCVTRRASTRSPHRPRRGGEGGGGEMVDGDGDEESAHDVRRPAAPHTPPVGCAEREGHRWGGRSVGSHRCSGWGRQERAQARDLGVLCAHLPLRPLRAHPFIFPPGRGSAPLRQLLITIGESIPPSTVATGMARAAPASPRYEGEDAGYGEGDEDGDGVGSDVGGALREAYPHEGD